MEMIKITDFKIKSGKKIHFQFNDGTEKTIDFQPFIGKQQPKQTSFGPHFFQQSRINRKWTRHILAK
jgi:hypothetical protein